MTIHELLERLWEAYIEITPDAGTIHRFLKNRGETITNDHIAFRTLACDPIRLERIGQPFVDRGYSIQSEVYKFEDKHLTARYYRHPDPALPKVFISELLLDELPKKVADQLRALASQVDPRITGRPELLTGPLAWKPVTAKGYVALLKASEYAAWVAAFGIRANHFTVLFNNLLSFRSLQDLTAFLKDKGLEINGAGGEIKGSPAVLLEQASTLANEIEQSFARGEKLKIRSCYYEFARRYLDPVTGGLYQGFIPTSANRLFESTHVRRP